MAEQLSLFDDPDQPAPAGPAADRVADAPDPGLIAVETLTSEEKAARLDTLRLEAIGCERCGLSRTRTHVVFGEGNPAAPLVLVGEGPGENEDATGRPFVGRAGKLLDDVLRRNGMTRTHVYICNVIKCRAANLEGGRWRNRSPEQGEIDACQSWLEQQLGTIRPLVIVCLGAPAANTTIHKGFRMTAERGRWFTHSSHAPWVTAVFHPAYVLRLEGAAYDQALETLVEDIGSARRKVIEVKKQRSEAAAPAPRTLFE